MAISSAWQACAGARRRRRGLETEPTVASARASRGMDAWAWHVRSSIVGFRRGGCVDVSSPCTCETLCERPSGMSCICGRRLANRYTGSVSLTRRLGCCPSPCQLSHYDNPCQSSCTAPTYDAIRSERSTMCTTAVARGPCNPIPATRGVISGKGRNRAPQFPLKKKKNEKKKN